MKTLSIWRYNRVTGLWDHERSCTCEEYAQPWLARFQKDEPGETFKLSRMRPTGKPRPCISRAKFDKVRETYNQAHDAWTGYRHQLYLKYGTTQNVHYSGAERRELDRLGRADTRAADRIWRLLDASPREWRQGVPAHWVCSALTYEDAIRPANEPLSVVPPCAYGYTVPIK